MNALFNERKFYEFANSINLSLDNKISKLTKSDFDQNTIEELTESYYDDNKISIPELLEDCIYQSQPKDIKIPIKRRGGYYSENTSVDGTKFSIAIPFKGDYSLFRVLPTRHMSVLPYGILGSDDITIEYKVPVEENSAIIKSEFDKNLDTIKEYLEFLSEDAVTFNNKLGPALKIALERRKNKLESDDEIARGFGFPIK